MLFLIKCTCILLLISNIRCLSNNRLIDLSYTYGDTTPTHPLHTRFDLRPVRRGMNKFGIWVELNDFCTSEHAGTHMDAPVHFSRNGRTIDQIPLERLYRIPGVKIDVTSKILGNVNYEIRPSDLEDWIRQYGQLPDGCVVLFETGWGKKAFDIQAYSGMDDFGKLNFPSLGEDAAEWLINYGNRSMGYTHGVLGVGLDVISLDVGQSIRFPAHVNLLSNDKYGIENLKDLHKLPPRDFTLTMLPVKVGQGSGAPVRVLAEIGGDPSGTTTSALSLFAALLSLISLFTTRTMYF